MGRKRKDGNPLGLEKGVYWHHGQFRYRHRDGAWQNLGTDVERANATAQAINSTDSYGTLGFWILELIKTAKAGKLPAGRKLSERSISDYEEQLEYIKVSPLWTMFPEEIVKDPKVLGDYRDNRVNAQGKGKVRANRELSLVSSTFRWIIEESKVPGLLVNPVPLISRFKEQAKDRYVEDTEYRPIVGFAQRSVCMALELVYQTLQRPEDVLRLTPGAVRTKAVNGVATRVLTVQQGKRGRIVDIELTPQLEEALRMLTHDGDAIGTTRLSPTLTRVAPTLVHTTAGKPYTREGLGAMLRRYCHKAGVRTFGLMDVRAKGATDMYLNGVPLERIQLLMRHKSKTTTEIYIKRILETIQIARPNARVVGA